MVLETILIVGLGFLLLLAVGELASLDSETYMLGEKLKNEALTENEKDDVVIQLLNKLDDEDSNIRKTAITVLASANLVIKNQTLFFAKLFEMKDKDPNHAIRDMVIISLDSLSNKLGHKDFQNFYNINILPIIKKEERIDKSISQLESLRAKKRKEAIWTLGDLIAQKAVTFLEITAIYDNNIRVRAWATFALGQIGGDAAIKCLRNISIGEDKQLVRMTSIIALRNLNIKDIGVIVDEQVLDDVKNDLLQERVEIITAPHKINWWVRQKPVVKQIIVGTIMLIIGGFIGWAIGLIP